jgi:hypothetical protein
VGINLHVPHDFCLDLSMDVSQCFHCAVSTQPAHLSMLGSIGAGLWFSPCGMLSELGSARSAECWTVVLTLSLCQ